MLETQNGVDAIAIALLILHRIILTNQNGENYVLCSNRFAIASGRFL